MRKPGLPIVAAAVCSVAFIFSASAQAAPCPALSESYDSGGDALSTVPNDPLFPRQWGLQQIHAPQAWALGALGAGATIAVVDSGVDATHPDLRDRLVAGANFTSGESCDAGTQDLNGH